MMKKLLLLLSILLFTTNCFAQELSVKPIIKDAGKQVYRTQLGEANDEVIIGDSKSIEFKPEITFTKWNKENSLTIKPLFDIPNAVTSLVGNKIEHKGDKIGWYANPDSDNVDNLKFGLILYEKPATNTWSFQLEDNEELEYLYQPPMTERYKIGDFGGRISRITEQFGFDSKNKIVVGTSEEMIGGYTIVHRSKRDYILGQTNYMNGIIGNIPRPKFIDTNGDWVWGIIEINYPIYKVTCPQEFLDKAVYPVKANDTFGYTTIGGSYETGWNGSMSIFKASPSSSGTVTSISVAIYFPTAGNLAAALYDHDAANDLAENKLAESGSVAVSTGYNDWKGCPVSQSVTSGVNYWIAHTSDRTDDRRYGTWSGGRGGYWLSCMTFPTFPATFTDTPNQVNDTTRYSQYATYTPSAATTDQKSFQFFNADGALPAHPSVASSSTVTVMNSGSDTAETAWTTDVPAQSTGDMIIVNLVSDANVTHGTLPGGPKGEQAWTINTASLGDTSTANQRISCWYWTASGDNAAWSIVITPSATEQRTATVMKVPAGQYNTTTPIGETANAVNSSNAAALPSPSWTVTNAGGRVVVWIGDDQDPLITAPTGWSAIASVDRGNVNGILSLRDAVTTANEVVASATWTIASDSYCSIGYVINAPADTGRTALGVKGADVTCSVDTSYGWQFRLENTGATSSDAYKLQYKLNAGSWTDITDTSNVIKATLTGDFANGADVPEFVLGTGTYDTDNNSALESAGNFTLAAALAASHSTEGHLNFQIPNADVVNADTIQLRVVYNTGTVLEAYTDTPTITVSEAGGGAAATGTIMMVD